jgi:hypothetical protein
MEVRLSHRLGCEGKFAMKTKPNSRNVASGHEGKAGRCFLHEEGEPELDAEQVRQRASRLSGTLRKILKRPDSPEHFEPRK